MKQRQNSLQEAKNQAYDLVVIGGGITGAGIAQNAAARGISVLLIEKGDFASGTSSKTTKLIHGGLRYLQQMRFKLTRQLCEERERLKRLAPHLVKDLPFVLPFTRENTVLNFKTRLGLSLYDILTLSTGQSHAHTILTKKKIASLTPAFSEKIVSGGVQFHDAVTDDSRMVLTVLKAAEQKGANLLNYVQVSGFQIENQKITGVNCHDRYSGEEFSVSCKVCVNATGVWSDEVSAMVDTGAEKRVTPSKGIHIVVPSSAFETNTALFLPTKDARFVFLLPWKHALMIGTTESAYSGDIENLRANQDEIDYLLSVVNGYTNSHKLNRSDVKASFAGLRPLVNLNSENKTNTSTMSREHVIFDSPSGLINIAGGKLTSYRLMAEELMNTIVIRYPGIARKSFSTENEMLGGWTSKDDFLAKTAGISSRARRLSIDPAAIQHLIENYGAEADLVLDIVEKQPALSARIIADFPPIMAEVSFAVQNEMAVSLQDFFFRRTRLGIINHRQSMEAAPRVADLMAEACGWEDYRKKMELTVLESEMFEKQEEEIPVSS